MFKTLSLLLCGIGCLLVGLTAPQDVVAQHNWPRWRGPNEDGHSPETDLPVTWDANSVIWKTALPGRGQSSPVIWDDRIFLTAAVEGGKQRAVLGLDRKSGKLLWEQTVEWQGDPEELHVMNTHASATCATDGQRVYAFFGRGGLHCFTVEGKHVWSKNVGSFEKNPWGTAACPVLFEDLLIQNGDNDVDAFLLAVNKKTGEDVWHIDRPNNRGWSTPVFVTVEGRPQMLLNGHTGVTAYDPKTGEQLWHCNGFNGRGEPTVTPGKGQVFLVNGLAGDIYSVKLGGRGDVTNTHMAWHTPRRNGRDLPSPIVVDNYLFVASMSGVGTCYDTATGKILWQDRLGGEFASSPVAANGLIYFQSIDGKTLVIRPGEKYDLVARNDLAPSSDEIFRASLTPCNGQFFARSNTALYCIGKSDAKAK